MHAVVHIDHLPQCGRRRIDHVVAQYDGEGLVSDQILRHQDGVAQTERLTLSHVRDADQCSNLSNFFELGGLAAL